MTAAQDPASLSVSQRQLLAALLRGDSTFGSDRTREALRRRGLAEGVGSELRLTDEGAAVARRCQEAAR